MGVGQSNPPSHEIQRTMSRITFEQLLYKVSEKVSDLHEVLSNLKEDRRMKGRMPDNEAAQYLAQQLGSTESELSKFRLMLNEPVRPQRDREQKTEHLKSKEYDSGTPKRTHNVPNIGALQTQLEYCKDELSTAQKSLKEVKAENMALKANSDEVTNRNEVHKKEVQKMQDENRNLVKLNEEYKKELQKMRDENGSLLHRLSKLTSDKLTADNPNIADLSDPYRPIKLVEMMSELYDNQWTDAYVALQPLKNDERLVVKILLQTFMDIYDFCKEKSRSLFSMSEKTMKALFEDMNKTMKEKDLLVKNKYATLCSANGKEMAGLFTELSFAESKNKIFFYWEHEQAENDLEKGGDFKVVKDVWPDLEGELKKVRKEFGVAMVPIVTKAYLKPRWSKSCVKELKPYIKRCFYVAWMMCVQTPPMALAAIPRQDEVFDVNLYSAYSKRGNKVDFVVWPAVLLEEQQFGKSAAVMRKGVANGKD